MRVTNKLTYTSSLNNISSGENAFYKINQQVGSGLAIQNSYEDSSVYIDNTRLEYEIKTIEQVTKGTNSAQEMTKNSMKALSDMSKLLENFKVKLTQAASDSNSQTSREAIAKELEKIKESIVQLANTSINGQYIFAGSFVANKPFDSNGNYYGDKNSMNVVTGSGTQSQYNIPGWDLFFKADNDYKKEITTNVSLIDNKYDLHKNPDKKTYINSSSKWQDLIGQNYTDNKDLEIDKDFEYTDSKLSFPPSALYVQGTKPDGTTFKSSVLIEPDSKIEDVLKQIGSMYGNTDTNTLVNVSINDSGQIQITDLKQGNNKLDFHAVAFTPSAKDRQTLVKLIDTAKKANPALSMDSITNSLIANAVGNNATSNDITKLGASNATVTIGNETFSLSLKRTDFIKSNNQDIANNQADAADYDNVYFEKNGNVIYGNVSQIIKDSNEYATDTTKLSQTMANNSLNNTILNLNVSSKGGNNYNVSIDLAKSSISYVDKNNQTITFPFMQTDPFTNNSGIQTQSNDITYKQLNDVIAMFASDQIPTQSINVTNNKITQADYDKVRDLINASKSVVDVSMDYKGRISISDKFSSSTDLKVALSDSQTGLFEKTNLTTTASIKTGPNFSFSANNALVIDEPNVDFVKDLDAMIDSVLKGNMRADSESNDPRNTGMQGALARLDHLADHINKLNTTMGAYSNNIQNVNDRMKLLSVNVKTIKSNVIDADYSEVLMNLMQTQIAYQASLKASSTISGLSLLNYM